jgi:nucleoside-diphosphate-sugar epimerase
MKILVIGSTGPQGREFVAQALAVGHAVCAFARNPAALQPAPGLEVLRGDVFDQHSLDAAARGQDAAVSMLGVSLAAARRPTNVFSQGTRNLIAALKGAGVRRLIVQSSFGVGDSRRDAGLLERVFYALLLRGAYADKVLQEQVVSESGLDYTIVRPPRLTTATGTGRYTARRRPFLDCASRRRPLHSGCTRHPRVRRQDRLPRGVGLGRLKLRRKDLRDRALLQGATGVVARAATSKWPRA